MHKIVEGAQRFFQRRFRIEMMQKIEIEIIGAQASQARFDRAHDMAARTPFGIDVRADFPGDFA